MSASLSISTRIPQPSVPFLDAQGGVNRPWLYYFIAILNRTGGEIGVKSTDQQTQTGSVNALIAMDDVEFPPPPTSLGVLLGEALADTTQPIPPALGVLLGMALADDVPRAPLNPFLAALLVADASLT
jgi:hypothetical protein